MPKGPGDALLRSGKASPGPFILHTADTSARTHTYGVRSRTMFQLFWLLSVPLKLKFGSRLRLRRSLSRLHIDKTHL